MNIFEKRFTCAMVLGLAMLAAKSGQAGLIPSGSPLSSLLAADAYMEIDGFRFESFALAPDPPTTFQPDPSEIAVSTFHDQTNKKVRLIFTIAGANRILRPGESYDMRLEFDAHAPGEAHFNQQRLDITGDVVGSGEVGVFEAVETIEGVPQTLANLGTVIFGDAAQLADVAELLEPQAWLHIRKDIGVFGGFPESDGDLVKRAALTDIGQIFMYTELPEPAIFALAAFALVAALSVRSRPERSMGSL